ncbi:MAG: hypothetical protein Q8P89_01875 [bacterium]|nr:hypothetical protein [bacterium]
MSRNREVPFPFGVVAREGGEFAVSITDGVGPSSEIDNTFDVQIVPGMDVYKTEEEAKRDLTAALKPGGKLDGGIWRDH